MIHAGTDHKHIEPGLPEQQLKDMRQQLAKAEQQTKTLQKKVSDQKQQLRELRAETKREGSLAAECEELKVEVADLRSETRDVIRANRQLVEKIEALQAEIAQLKAGTKNRKPSGLAAGLFLPSPPYRRHGESIKTRPGQNARQAQIT